MRSLVLGILLVGLSMFSLQAQNSTSTSTFSNAVSLSLPQLNVSNNTLGLRLGGFEIDSRFSLSAYNSVTGSNDIFYPTYDENFALLRYEKKATVFLPENIFRGNKIDSFNPYGADSPQQAVLAGLLNLLFD